MKPRVMYAFGAAIHVALVVAGASYPPLGYAFATLFGLVAVMPRGGYR